jgi:ribosomal protein S18 acetylase RimI-like enzyme
MFLTRVLEHLSGLSCSGLMLTVDMGNAAACGLYRSFGFQLLEEVPEFYGRGEDRHLMRLDLT